MKTKTQEDLETKPRNNYMETEQRVRTQEYQIGDHVKFFIMKDQEDKEWGDISEVRQNENGVYEYLIINEDYSYGWISAYDILCKSSNPTHNQITSVMKKKVKDLTVEELVRLQAQLVHKQSRAVKVNENWHSGESKVKSAGGKFYSYYELYVDDKWYTLEDEIEVE